MVFDCFTSFSFTHHPLPPVNGQWRVIRDCARVGEPGVGGDERFCLHKWGTFDIYVEECTCASKDGCNGAERMGSSVSAAVTGLVLLLTAFGAAR